MPYADWNDDESSPNRPWPKSDPPKYADPGKPRDLDAVIGTYMVDLAKREVRETPADRRTRNQTYIGKVWTPGHVIIWTNGHIAVLKRDASADGGRAQFPDWTPVGVLNSAVWQAYGRVRTLRPHGDGVTGRPRTGTLQGIGWDWQAGEGLQLDAADAEYGSAREMVPGAVAPVAGGVIRLDDRYVWPLRGVPWQWEWEGPYTRGREKRGDYPIRLSAGGWQVLIMGLRR